MLERKATIRGAKIVASQIADSVDAASKVNPELQILHIIQPAQQRSANGRKNANRVNARMSHAFITEEK